MTREDLLPGLLPAHGLLPPKLVKIITRPAFEVRPRSNEHNVRTDRRVKFSQCFRFLEFAASSITFNTSAGCESIITWHDANSMVLAFILFAIKRSKSG